MARILFRGPDVITLDEHKGILRGADVAVDGPLIAGVGDVPEGFVADEVVDAQGQIVFPGFFNAHTHAALALLRATAFAPEYAYALTERGFISHSGLDADDVRWGAQLAMVEMIRGGTIGFADQYFFMDTVAEAAVESGMRAALAWCTFGGETAEVGVELPEIPRFVERWQGAGGGRLVTMLGPHSVAACSPRFLARTAAVAARLGVGIHVHLAATREEVEGSLRSHDLTPVEVLDRNGVFDVPVLAAHGAHLGVPDIEILASRNVTIVTTPTTAMRLNTGLTPVAALREAGVQVAIGTGAPPSCGALDMLAESRVATLVHLSAQGLLPMEATLKGLLLACEGGARGLGFPMSGRIAAGANADLVMVNTTGVHLQPPVHPLTALGWAGTAGDVSDVMVAGRWLMRNRTILTLDEPRILQEARARGLAWLKRAGAGA